jgi:SAM-dependent MidA family methyltransferase
LNALHQEIAATIAAEGPISLELYMKLALTHPLYGYYRSRMPIGKAGDFITAPEIHQMFGELIGLWAAEVWHIMGEPAHLLLVELGPGRGTLMADALRAARIVPKFHRALDVHLVETSETLGASQRQALSFSGVPLTWHSQWESIPQGPVIIVANEFFDALPIRHYVYGPHGWHERLVGLSPDGQFMFGLAGEPNAEIEMQAEEGTILEAGLSALDMMTKIATHLRHSLGALLAIDYGSSSFQFGTTLQAVRHHRFADPLQDPGEADLTAHVDFSGLAQAAQKAGAVSHGPVSQGLFLQRLGIFERAQKLAQNADAAQKLAIEQALDRLVRPGPRTGARASMAELFKVLAVTSEGLPSLPGFEGEGV